MQDDWAPLWEKAHCSNILYTYSRSIGHLSRIAQLLYSLFLLCYFWLSSDKCVYPFNHLLSQIHPYTVIYPALYLSCSTQSFLPFITHPVINWYMQPWSNILSITQSSYVSFHPYYSSSHQYSMNSARQQSNQKSSHSTVHHPFIHSQINL